MEADDSASFLTLSLEERISHKLWKARQHAYNELETMFEQASVGRAGDPAIAKYYKRPELFESYITDSNVVAQESAVKALLSFLKYMAEVPGIVDMCGPGELVSTWVPALVEKGCTASKAGTKEASMACILLVVSFDKNICNCITVLEPMWSKKLPKLLTAALSVCASTIEQYGFVNASQQEKMQVLQSLVQVLPKLCSHADKNVRNESMKVILQLYTWFDKPVLQDLLLAKLKPIQQKDLDKMFQSYEGSIPPASTPSLFVWAAPVVAVGQQDEDELASDNHAHHGVDSDGDTMMMGNNVAIDPYEMYPVQTILDKLPNGFYSNLSSAKWKDRVEALEEFYEKSLANGKCKKLSARDEDYSELVRKYCSIITSDANLQAVQLATSSIDVLVSALRSDFNSFALDTLNALLTRSKEKKANVADVIFSTLLNLSNYYKLEMCLDSILTHMKTTKVPQVKIVTCKFLFELLTSWRPAEQLYKTMVFASLSEILSSLQPIVNDNQQATRNEAFKCVAALIKIFGERELATYLEKLDNLKRKKILELVDGIEVKASASSSSSTQQGGLKPAALVPQTRSRTVPSTNSNSSSTIPSKRLATSPLKPRAASSVGRSATVGAAASATKSSRLTSRSLATPQLPRLDSQPRSNASVVQQQQQQPEPFPSASSSSSSSAAFQSSMSTRMSHLNDEVNKLRQERQDWLKERNELLSNLNNSKLQISKLSKQLNDAEIAVSSLQRQLQDSKVELNDKDIKIRELEARLSHGVISNGNAAAATATAASPLSASSSASINRGRLTSTTLSPLRSSTKAFNSTNTITTNTNSATTTTPPHRMRSPSESSDDLPRRVTSLNLNNHLMQEESWKRAAEVTNQLKARIERMRAKSRSGFKDAPPPA